MRNYIPYFIFACLLTTAAFAQLPPNTPINFVVQDYTHDNIVTSNGMWEGFYNPNDVKISYHGNVTTFLANRNGESLPQFDNRGAIGVDIGNSNTRVCEVTMPVSLMADEHKKPTTFSIGYGNMPPPSIQTFNPAYGCIASRPSHDEILVKIIAAPSQ